MPPSPAMRASPGRELRGNNHKRRHSLEGGILLRGKEDDLALFHDMQTRERDNFLLQSNEEFEDTFSTKLRYFSDYKLGISIPSRGESSDLLNVDGEKNDYDWLLTPPDTPLFRYLDDETPPITLAQRGRPRSQPVTISRSLTMEKSHRSSRGSASPNRLSPSPRSGNSSFQTRGSPSPRSGNSSFQTRGRPSSSSHSSPTPSLHHTTSSRRPSPPPSKPSTPAPRSSTPTPRQMSTGSSGTVSTSGRRGTSPVKTSRGNSASPKMRAWQMNIPGFSLDAPPNLRTSLADRPTSYVRGSSPASRNGKDSFSRSGRQSMSPTASRSVGSSHSHDRERLSSHSKGSVASSGDDDVDSLQSIPMSSSDHAASRRVGQFQSNRGPTFSKKTTRSMLSSSAPKRSFDTALRQMENRKGPQNMFRPLLSSVPSSSFYVGKASSVQRPMVSRNSSVTTSSNASSDLGTSGPHDTEESDRNLYDMANECVKAPYPDVEDDVFAFEKADTVNEDISHDSHNGSCNVQRDYFSGGAGVDCQLSDTENFDNSSNAIAITTHSECVDVKGNSPEVDKVEGMVLCSRCGCRYCPIELIEGDLKICPDCRRSFEPLTSTSPVPTVAVPKNSPSLSANVPDEHISFDAMDPLIALPESSEGADMAEAMASQDEDDVQDDQTSYLGKNLNLLPENSLVQTLEEEDMQSTVNQQLIDQPTLSYNPSHGDAAAHQSRHSSQYQNSKLDVSDGTGISVVLKRSSSSKGPVVQSRSFSATNIPYNDPSYVRDGATSMRSSLGQGSSSTSSSLDFGSVRQMETRMQRQLSGRKSDMETYRHDINTKHQRTGSSFSGTSGHAVQGLGLAMSTNEETMEVAVNVDNKVLGVTNVATPEMLLVTENAGLDDAYTGVECDNHYEPVVASASELSTHTLVHSGGSSVAPLLNIEESSSYGYGEAVQNDQRIISDQEPSVLIKEPSDVEEDILLNSVVDRVDVADIPTLSSLDKISEIDIENSCLGSPGSQSDVVSSNSKSTLDDFLEHSVVITCDNDMADSVAEADTLDNTHGILVESHAGTKARSLTLEEATDAILFCSSIIHNLAYKAATIAMEKENSVPLELEGSRPMVTILGNSNSDVKGPHRRTAGRRASKSQKLRQTPAKADTKPSPDDPDGDENVNVPTTRIVGVSNKSDGMKPPKLESKCNCTIM
ncbi:flocculation protein FLO11-like isoform X2 [Diospyros lotus]|uniref:flocculation protein FLO11-like isoform X2 n=1 Tax=Diospyros lotus TaxID=55363 RepID=UPI0022581EC3|nr:flocculation protein FLO11-like isoform X2 [Diospyros lotus]